MSFTPLFYSVPHVYIRCKRFRGVQGGLLIFLRLEAWGDIPPCAAERVCDAQCAERTHSAARGRVREGESPLSDNLRMANAKIVGESRGGAPHLAR